MIVWRTYKHHQSDDEGQRPTNTGGPGPGEMQLVDMNHPLDDPVTDQRTTNTEKKFQETYV